jgi:hypothetical protein
VKPTLFLLVATRATACASSPVAPSEVASAAAGTTASAEVIPPPVEDEDPIICKSVEPTGSRIATRSCMRKSERDALRRNSQEETDAIQRKGTQTGNPTFND